MLNAYFHINPACPYAFSNPVSFTIIQCFVSSESQAQVPASAKENVKKSHTMPKHSQGLFIIKM